MEVDQTTANEQTTAKEPPNAIHTVMEVDQTTANEQTPAANEPMTDTANDTVMEVDQVHDTDSPDDVSSEEAHTCESDVVDYGAINIAKACSHNSGNNRGSTVLVRLAKGSRLVR
jgi:hypothetical protein